MSTPPVNEQRRRWLGGLLAASTAPLWSPLAQAGEWAPWPSAGSPGASQPPHSQQQNAPQQNSIPDMEDFWSRPRVLHLTRYQTNEKLEVPYWKDGAIHAEGYRQVCWLMRDLPAKKYAAIDVRVLDLLCAMQSWVTYYGFSKPFFVTSGYRTEKTNASLEGAAKNSMHLRGCAVDIIVPDLPVSYLGQLAQHYSAGGVGFYPDRGFIHVDTGRIRSWGRRR